ncbi:hypothetical protein, partial [Sulfoacidibacillus ferrooxidans]|uniref:hypothetical protein n=1 Tax=Sulfoacidibacillus ferrooxidans TaxID=2005001 RepID=UPI001F50EF4E
RIKVESHNAAITKHMKSLIEEGNQVKAEVDRWLAVPEAQDVEPLIQARIAQFEQDERLDVQEAATYTAQTQMITSATQKMKSVEHDLSVI